MSEAETAQSLTDREWHIIEAAQKHDGKYLLRRRFGRDESPPSETDLDYEACESLVAKRLAVRLSGASTYAPGISLTGFGSHIAAAGRPTR